MKKASFKALAEPAEMSECTARTVGGQEEAILGTWLAVNGGLAPTSTELCRSRCSGPELHLHEHESVSPWDA